MTMTDTMTAPIAAPKAASSAPDGRIAPAKRDLIAAFKALRRLLADKEDTGQVFEIMAALNGDMDFVKLLIAKGAEVNKKGWTPLHYAAANGHDDIVTLLLRYSAYVDAGSPNGTTPLMMAARGGHVSTAKLLLDAGADINVKNQIGLNALDFAKQYKEPDAIKGLTARMEQMQKQQQQGGSAPAAQ